VVRRTLVLRLLETRTLKNLKRTSINVLGFHHPTETERERKRRRKRKSVVRRTLMLPSFETRTLNSLKQTSIIVLVFIIPQCQTEKKNAVKRTIMLRLSKARTHLPQTNAHTKSAVD
jgi:hypothetical protein